jgi:glycerol uptake facilitator-like aquaporin
MSIRDRYIAITLSLIGISVCCLGVFAFFTNFVNTTLPWNPGQSMRAHYMAVGQSYGQGFFIGFFLCFFLMLVALACWKGIGRHTAPVPDPFRRPGI